MIEVFGLSGAGKTTTFDRVQPLLERRLADTSNLIATPRDVPGPQAIAAAARIIAVALARDPSGLAGFLAHRQNWWLPAKLGFRAAGIGGRGKARSLLLVNSGVLQPFVQFEIVQNLRCDAVPFDALAAALSLPSAVVYICANPDTARQRWIARNQAEQRNWISDGLTARFERAHERCEQLVEFCRKEGIPLMVCDTESELGAEALEDLSDFITSAMKSNGTKH